MQYLILINKVFSYRDRYPNQPYIDRTDAGISPYIFNCTRCSARSPNG